MKIRHALLLLYLFFVPPCFAQDLPDKPQPITVSVQGKPVQPFTVNAHTEPAGHVADREFWLEAGSMAAAWTADTITTAHDFGQSPLDHEGGVLFHGSRSVPQVMGTYAAIDIAAGVTAYEWKRHVHNRYLHPLWRVPMLFMGVNHTDAAIQNLTMRTK